MGLYTITTRAAGTVLTGFGSTSDIFNADHENHVTHTEPTSINSFEDTLAHMQATTNPLTNSGLPSLPAALSDEIQRLRYAIAQIKQKISAAATAPFWYTATADFSAFVMFPPTACRLEAAVAQVVATGTITDVQFDTTIYDTTSVMAAGNRIKAPADGVYIVGGTLAFGDGATDGPKGDFVLTLRHDRGVTGTTIAANEVFSDNNETPKAITVESVYEFQKNDLLALTVFQTDGSSKATVSEAQARPALWMALVGRD